VKHVAGLFYTFLFVNCSLGLAVHLVGHRWLLAVAAACGLVWSGCNAYLWSRK